MAAPRPRCPNARPRPVGPGRSETGDGETAGARAVDPQTPPAAVGLTPFILEGGV